MPINTNLNKTKRYSRFTYGDNGQFGKRNILAVSFVSGDEMKPAAAGTTQLMTATALSNTTANSFTVTPNPDVPRNIVITIAGTAANVPAGNVVITGVNVEGKVITETLALTQDATGTLTGNLAFKNVTSITAPQADGTGVTLAAGYGVKIGIGMRNLASMPAQVLVRTGTVETIEAPSATAYSATLVEANTVTFTSAPNASRMYRVYVLNYKWAVNPLNGQPDYGL